MPCFTYRYCIFGRFANTPSDRDAIALELKSLKMDNAVCEMLTLVNIQPRVIDVLALCLIKGPQIARFLMQYLL